VLCDVMLSAGGCETWLTLVELSRMTHYGEASISAQPASFAETAVWRVGGGEAPAGRRGSLVRRAGRFGNTG
jgi:hypothetical protein